MRVLLVLLFLVVSCFAGTLMRVASGGPGGTDASGNVWAPDSAYSGGFTWSNGALAPPFANLRYGTSFSYTFQVAPGNYSVILKLIEPNKTAGAARLFSVSINGAVGLSRFDLFQVAGLLVPYSISFPVTSQGFIQIVFTGNVGNAVVSGIQIDDAPIVPATRRTLCEVGLGDGRDSMFSGVYPIWACENWSGGPVRVVKARCRSDFAAELEITSKVSGLAMLAGPIVCTPEGTDIDAVGNAVYQDRDVLVLSFRVLAVPGSTARQVVASVLLEGQAAVIGLRPE